ncbi:hypothetical protein QQ054_32080 [Oscillatoria amoena NRMC-F 0135]|nr:hypothetical protein [Oscillatoria amoena NRMC-F 0135]
MRTIDLNFQPTTPTGEPHLHKMMAGQWFADELNKRISTDNPVFELQASISFRDTNTFTGTDEQINYLKNILIALPVDNLWKGQLLAKFTA